VSGRRGFSLPELLIALAVGMVVIVAGADFAVRTFKSRRGWTVREGVDRNARFVGLSLQRDAASTGVAIESAPTFATINTAGDTLSILSVPRMTWTGTDSIEAPVYPLYDDGGPGTTYPPGGNCGATCLEFTLNGQPLNIRTGDLVHLRIGTVRRLLLVTGSTNMGGALRFRITFLDVPALVGRPSGLSNVLLLRAGTSMQQVRAVLYWRDAATNQLLRADRFSVNGAPEGSVVSRDVAAFTPRLQFLDGEEAPTFNGVDADSTNDGDDIIGLRVRAQLRAERTDAAVNGGTLVQRWYEWRMAPRNLLYEKNR